MLFNDTKNEKKNSRTRLENNKNVNFKLYCDESEKSNHKLKLIKIRSTFYRSANATTFGIGRHQFSWIFMRCWSENKNHGNLDSNSYITSTDCLKGLRRNFKLLGWFHHRVEMSGFNEFLDYLIIQISNATWHFVGNKPLLITKR